MARSSIAVRLAFAVPLIAFVAVAIWVAVPLLRGDDPHRLPSTLIDQPAPDFALPPLPGRTEGLSRADLGGQVVLVNFFASWCVPCLAEHPVLTRLAREQGVAIFAINYRDRPEDAQAWLERNGNPFTRIGADAEGRTAIDWGVYGVPETFVIDRAGRVRFRWPGPLTPQLVTDTILPLVAQLRQ